MLWKIFLPIILSFLSFCANVFSQPTVVYFDTRDHNICFRTIGATETVLIDSSISINDATDALNNELLGDLYRSGELSIDEVDDGLSLHTTFSFFLPDYSQYSYYPDSRSIEQNFNFSPFVPISSRYVGLLYKYTWYQKYSDSDRFRTNVEFRLIITDITTGRAIAAPRLSHGILNQPTEYAMRLTLPVILPDSNSSSASESTPDLNKDGFINSDDLNIFIQDWHKKVP